MIRETGEKSFPIWLLGDSEPKRWQDKLYTPFDPRHPIRHNIWTSILDLIQKELYLRSRIRLDSDRIFIRNAVADPINKPEPNLIDWSSKDELLKEIQYYRTISEKYQPKLILSFGAFSFEFGRRALEKPHEHAYNYWGAKNLGDAFRTRISSNNIPNLIPLMHRVIAGGQFPNAHRFYLGKNEKDPIPNYFEYVAQKLTDIIQNIEGVFL